MNSPQSFVDFLNASPREDEKVLVALRFYLAELTNDKLPRELLHEVERSIGDEGKTEAAVARLKADRESQVQVALAFMADRWTEPVDRDRIVRAFGGASTKLPVIEAGLIAIVGMYAMYLVATGGVRKRTTRVVRRPDGSFEEKVEVEMFGPTGPLQSIVALFKGGKAKEEK